MIALPVVDLPQPDSPTSPSVSPSQHVEADVRDRVDLQPGAPDRELDDEVLDAQQRLVVGAAGARCRCPAIRTTDARSVTTAPLVARDRRAGRGLARGEVARRARLARGGADREAAAEAVAGRRRRR